MLGTKKIESPQLRRPVCRDAAGTPIQTVSVGRTIVSVRCEGEGVERVKKGGGEKN